MFSVTKGAVSNTEARDIAKFYGNVLVQENDQFRAEVSVQKSEGRDRKCIVIKHNGEAVDIRAPTDVYGPLVTLHHLITNIIPQQNQEVMSELCLRLPFVAVLLGRDAGDSDTLVDCILWRNFQELLQFCLQDKRTIIIGGGPCAGKTTVHRFLREMVEASMDDMGPDVILIPEACREVIQMMNMRAPLMDEELWLRRLAFISRELNYLQLVRAKLSVAIRPTFVVMDRTTLIDGYAYIEDKRRLQYTSVVCRDIEHLVKDTLQVFFSHTNTVNYVNDAERKMTVDEAMVTSQLNYQAYLENFQPGQLAVMNDPDLHLKALTILKFIQSSAAEVPTWRVGRGDPCSSSSSDGDVQIEITPFPSIV